MKAVHGSAANHVLGKRFYQSFIADNTTDTNQSAIIH
jgi:hypothetical protein